jgi:hypothetical protein
MYKVVVGRLLVGKKRYNRGDLLDISDKDAIPFGVQVEKVAEVKRKRGRPKKDENQREVSGQS